MSTAARKTGVHRARTETKSAEYVLGTDTDESVRLGLQHRLWSAAAHEIWETAGLQPGMTALDLGCGPGYATLDMAQIVGPRGRVIGVDESATFLKQLNDQAKARRLENVDRVLGDVQKLEEAMPRSDASIDLAYARWVFCFLPHPEYVIRGLRRLLKPGGRLAVQDYFNYEAMTIAPKNAAFSKVIAAVGKSWRARGGDPDIMGRLPAMLAAAGFRIEHLQARQRLARPGSTLWHWPESFFSNYVPRLAESGFITEGDRDEFTALWKSTSEDPNAFIMLPAVYDLVAVRP
ncbi:MAG: methyltransferase domain-containing protein [Phycisphaerales bacterium]|nr:methyltransferase domain-containing protein [Phycisphaerales bacterium]